MKDLGDRLAALSPEQRALLEARLKQKGIHAPRATAIRPIPNRAALPHFPTSLDQERLWFIDQMEPGNPAYNIHNTTRLKGPIDLPRMERAINASIARHEVLRTTFAVSDGVPVQVVRPSLEIPLQLFDHSALPEAEREAAAHATGVAFATERFDLARGPLIRAGLARIAAEDHVLMVCMHHAITDRWSFDIFEREVGEAYVAYGRGEVPTFPPLPIQYADFAAWQRQEFFGPRLREHLAFWHEQLDDAERVLEIPTDYPRPAVQSFDGGRVYTVFSEELLASLKALTQTVGATMFMTTLAALDLVCWRYSGQRDLLIGSAIADRNREETEQVVGYFLNMLLFRAVIDPGMSFRQLLIQVRDRAKGAYAHQDVPFAALVSEFVTRQDPSRNPLMQVSYIYLDFPITTTPDEAGFTATSFDVDNGASRFDLTLACTEVPGLGLHSYFEYNRALYDAPKVQRMLTHLGRTLEFAVRHPDRPVAELDLLTAEEHQRLVVEFQPGSAEGEFPLHRLFDQAADRAPDAIALRIGDEVLSYAELRARAERVASALRRHGVGPDLVVPIAAQRSVAQVVGILGILKSGAAYAPLDLDLPEERLRAMLADLRPRCALAESRLLPRLPEEAGARLAIEELFDSPLEMEEAERRNERLPLDALAYVMFTSGSTGTPKGVMVSHRAILNRVLWSQHRYPLGSEDRLLATASYGFDIAIWELFGPWIAGATVVLPREGEQRDPSALVELLDRHAVTVVHFVPSLLRVLLEEPRFLAGRALRMVFCGGESMDRELHDQFRRAFPTAVLSHFYGPTEAAISCLYWDCRADLAPGPVPIGIPVDGARIYLLDDAGKPVPVGIPGEVHIGSTPLARGYLARPDLSATAFIPDAISGVPGARLYRTGDLARFREDGSIEFVGRIDHQVKIRGHRIEPGEIEHALRRRPEIRGAVATARGSRGAEQLVAYVVIEPATLREEHLDPAAHEADLRAELRRSLPEVMVPAAVVRLEEFPLGPNGKLDRRALPDPGSTTRRVHVAPRTSTEETIAGIWSILLQREPVGAEDDFFELGGNSLLATQVVSRLRAAFSIEFPLRRFFEGSTVATLARSVDELLIETLERMSEDEAAALLSRLEQTGAR